jgi:pimeloyl-ACP methyl ester carboxylesterase
MPGTHARDRHTAARTDRRVASTGLSLAVREYAGSAGTPAQPHVVLVHGYPDNQEMWRPLADRLVADGMHVVTYDVRGAGGSDVPADIAGYRTDRLVDDLVAVLDATVPAGAPVHLVGHDWGSVQVWEAVLSADEDPRLSSRIASFTSVSGPALDHLAHLARHPEGRRLRLLRQLGHSWYVYAFHVPVLPELVWRTAHGPIGRLAGRFDAGVGGDLDGWGPALGRDGANGVNLYRANVLRRMHRPTPRHTDVPVLVVAPLRDPFLTSVTVEDLDRLCSDVRVVRPATGHWLPRTHPDLLAELVSDHVRRHG